MGTVHLNLEDAPDGAINFQACFEGGFDPKSHAHQHAKLLIEYLDQIAEKRGIPEVSVLSDTQLRADADQGFVAADGGKRIEIVRGR